MPDVYVFFLAIGFPQQMRTCSSTQPQILSTTTLKPQTLHSYFCPFFTAPAAFFFFGVALFFVCVFFVAADILAEALFFETGFAFLPVFFTAAALAVVCFEEVYYVAFG